ncbi:hypothetical protein Aperf_G00000115817 [Anoplocephala perfoliata]
MSGDSNNQVITLKMKTIQLFLLISLVCTAFAFHGHHYHGFHEIHHDDDHHGEDFYLDDDSDLIPARSNYGSRRTVLWTGPSSYSGYRRYTVQKKPTPPPRPAYPPRVVSRQTYTPNQSYQSRYYQYYQRPYESSRQQPSRTVPLHNKDRRDDPRYRQGLQELADLM